jgi:hypothetical protein
MGRSEAAQRERPKIVCRPWLPDTKLCSLRSTDVRKSEHAHRANVQNIERWTDDSLSIHHFRTRTLIFRKPVTRL